MTPLGKFLRKWRIDNDMNQKQMAERLGCTPSYLSAIETGKKLVTVKFVRDLVQSFGIESTRVITLAEEVYSNAMVRKIRAFRESLYDI